NFHHADCECSRAADAVMALALPSPAQPPANPDAVKMYAEANAAANRHIAELEAREWRVAQGVQEQLAEAGKAAISIRNELDRTRAERDSWETQFHSAAAAASEYSEFWEKHQRNFDQFGNYIPHSQIDGDLRAAKAEIERLRAVAPERPFYGAECGSYPNCEGGCGLGCTKEIESAKATSSVASTEQK
ncbi:MAG TPA: hypothetical protein VK604_12310, partial [Bryobacteraceae bacterium]|nr:hypothetical protein [Bryobacteraceae bacterium]